MPTHSKRHDDNSPLAILTELAVEGTSSLVEAQRTFLNLVQQENDIIFNGVKERISSFIPAVAMTDLAQRSLDTFIGMQQELLTTTSKRTLQWLESAKGGKGGRAAHLVDFAREGVETFTRAQKKFLDLVAQEAATATGSRKAHDGKVTKKTELAQLAREAGNAFIEAQKRLLERHGAADEREPRRCNSDRGSGVAFSAIADGEPDPRRCEELFQRGEVPGRLSDQSAQKGRRTCQTWPGSHNPSERSSIGLRRVGRSVTGGLRVTTIALPFPWLRALLSTSA